MQQRTTLPETRKSQDHPLDRAMSDIRETRDQSAHPGFNRPSQASAASDRDFSACSDSAPAASNRPGSVQTSCNRPGSVQTSCNRPGSVQTSCSQPGSAQTSAGSACSVSNRDSSASAASNRPNAAPTVHTLSNPAEGFEEFWAVYPRKIAKGRTIRAWNELHPDAATRLEIMKNLALMIKSDAWKTQNGRFIPYPANWLNDRRWEDDPAEASRRFSSNSVLPIQSYKQRDYSEQIESDEEMFERLKRGCGIRSA